MSPEALLPPSGEASPSRAHRDERVTDADYCLAVVFRVRGLREGFFASTTASAAATSGAASVISTPRWSPSVSLLTSKAPLPETDAALRLALKVATLRAWHHQKRGPVFVSLGARFGTCLLTSSPREPQVC